MNAVETIGILPSAERTTTQTSDWYTNRGFKGCVAMLDVTANTSGELTLSIQGRIGAGIYTIATAAQTTDTTDVVLEVYPGLEEFDFDGSPTSDVARLANVFNAVLPGEFRFVVTAADSGAATYSLSASLVP